MNFFKKLFSSNKIENPNEIKPVFHNNEKEPVEEKASGNENEFNMIYTEEYFSKRYTEENIESEMLDNCSKMIESYLIDNHTERKVKDPINHPINLDQVDQDGFGFVLYCKAFQLEEEQATFFLAYLLSDYLINKYGFKLYKDSEPEYPLRGMTLKYDKEGAVLSLYPYEYASKVLNGNQTFSELEERLNSQLAEMPKVEDILNNFLKPEN